MNALVVYYSKSGNTEKVAFAIGAGIGVKPRRIEEINPSSVSGYDLIVLGSPVHGGKPSAPIMDFISRLPKMDGKKAAVFCTKSIAGDKPTMAVMEKALKDKGMTILGGFSAVGLSRFFADFGPRIFHRGHPSADELKRADEFGKNLVAKAQQPMIASV
jgi:flavodoxin